MPTQIITEYFRHVFIHGNAVSIDGIMYQSSRRTSGVSYVLFVDNEHCVDGETGPGNDGELHMLLPAGAEQVFGPRLSPWLAAPARR